MKTNKLILILGGIIFSATVFAWYGSRNISTKKASVFSKGQNDKHDEVGYRFPEMVRSALDRITKAHLKLNHYTVMNVVETAPVDRTDFENRFDTLIMTRSDKMLKVLQDDVIKLQDNQTGVLVFPDEKLIVMQDPDEAYFDWLKNFANYIQLDSFANLVSSSRVERVGNEEEIVFIEFGDLAVIKVEYHYDPRTYIIQKIVSHETILDDDDEPLDIVKTTHLHYTFHEKGELKSMFDLSNYYIQKGKNDFMPSAMFPGYTVHNGTTKHLARTKEKM